IFAVLSKVALREIEARLFSKWRASCRDYFHLIDTFVHVARQELACGVEKHRRSGRPIERQRGFEPFDRPRPILRLIAVMASRNFCSAGDSTPRRTGALYAGGSSLASRVKSGFFVPAVDWRLGSGTNVSRKSSAIATGTAIHHQRDAVR